MTTYYVATNGSNEDPGTISQPFLTINYAASVVSAGDTVYVRGGTYSSTASIDLSTDGTVTSPITFSSYPEEVAIIDGTNMPASTGPVGVSGNFNDFSNFVITNSKDTGIFTWNAHHIRIKNNNIYTCQRAAIWVGGDDDSLSYDNVIEGNTVRDCVRMNSARTLSAGWDSAIATELAKYTIIKGNKVYQNYGEGIVAHQATGAIIMYNTCYDNYSCNIYADNCPSAVINGNIVYCTSDSSFFLGVNASPAGERAIGISIGNEQNLASYWSDNIGIIANTSCNTWHGFFYDFDENHSLNYAYIADNVFVNPVSSGGNTATCIRISESTDTSNTNNTLIRNIFYRVPAGALQLGRSTGFSMRNNCWFGGTSGNFAGTFDDTTNPMFSSAAGRIVRALELQK